MNVLHYVWAFIQAQHDRRGRRTLGLQVGAIVSNEFNLDLKATLSARLDRSTVGEYLGM